MAEIPLSVFCENVYGINYLSLYNPDNYIFPDKLPEHVKFDFKKIKSNFIQIPNEILLFLCQESLISHYQYTFILDFCTEAQKLLERKIQEDFPNAVVDFKRDTIKLDNFDSLKEIKHTISLDSIDKEKCGTYNCSFQELCTYIKEYLSDREFMQEIFEIFFGGVGYESRKKRVS